MKYELTETASPTFRECDDNNTGLFERIGKLVQAFDVLENGKVVASLIKVRNGEGITTYRETADQYDAVDWDKALANPFYLEAGE